MKRGGVVPDGLLLRAPVISLRWQGFVARAFVAYVAVVLNASISPQVASTFPSVYEIF